MKKFYFVLLEMSADSEEKLPANWIDSTEAENATAQANEEWNALKDGIILSNETTKETNSDLDQLAITINKANKADAEAEKAPSAQKSPESWLKDIHTYDWYIAALNQLLKDINDYEQWIDLTWNSSSRKTMKISNKKLQQYKKDIQNKKQALENERIQWWKNIIYENEITKLLERKTEIDKIHEDIRTWQNWDFSDEASFPYNSPESTKTANRNKKEAIKFEQKFKNELKNAAILEIFEWNQENAIQFYKRIAEWNYTQADYNIYMAYATDLWPSFNRCGIAAPSKIPSSHERYNQWTAWSIDYSNLTLWESFKQWWAAWALDNLLSHCNNLTPWQRDTRKTLGTLWIIWWAIYWWIKFLKSKKMWFRGKAWIIAGTFLGTEVLLWETPISLFNKFLSGWLSREEIKNRFGHSFWKAADQYQLYEYGFTPAACALMVFNGWTTVKDIRELTQNFKDSPTARRDFYQQAETKLQHQSPQCLEIFRSTFPSNINFDETKWNTRLASFWVTNNSNENTHVYEIATCITMNASVIEKFKTQNWLKDTDNSVKKDEFKEFQRTKKEKNEVITEEELQTHINDWFDTNEKATYSTRKEDIDNINTLKSQVEWLWLEEDQKKAINDAVEKFYNERTIESKPNLSKFTLNISSDKKTLTVKSHNEHETQIDLTSKTIKNLWNDNGISFADLSEALDAADLTNKILSITKSHKPSELPPFKYEKIRKGICFNDNSLSRDDLKFWNMDFDTKILKINRLKNRWNIDKEAETYANYLSERWKADNKIENMDNYPIVKSLWIDFYNEEEVKNLEEVLNKIKNDRKFSASTEDSQPFDTKYWPCFWNWEKLIFTAINWKKITMIEDLSKFPTIQADENKEKFLNYMNNKNNWMRWSAIQ